MDKAVKLNSDYIKLKVHDKGWSLAEFAARLGVVYNTLIKYLESDECRINVVNKMAKILEVDVDAIIYLKQLKEN